MNFLRLSPVVLSFLLIAAHFQRAGATLPVIGCLLAPGLLLIARPWSARLLQALLLLAAGEWTTTLVGLVQLHQELGQPWVRLAVILSLVIIFTCCSALLFRFLPIRERYGL